ncbi:Bug family tripartite tricarboxylate transporter substrate binding protein [Ottowia sp.]|uniref:Bug family tripartite tricarboxylate transporter substrate binding protein n=2 Tax=Ottowia sp. TaxID=1898956 RepID=UPI00337CBA05|nr:tripartite tricarboxylate transporter substrate binding protein [Burkholderiaceae bacterium]
MQRRLFTLAATALAATSLAAPLAARAQAWPAHPVKLVVGFPGGSTPDMVARAISEPLAQALGQPVIVENKPGASGNIAADYVAKATDGLTLGIVINGNLTSSKMLYSKLPYDPGKDFRYISLLTTAPLILVAPTSEPAGAAFFAEAKQQGDKWNYGSVGAGSVAHLGMELLKSKVPGLKPLHVPYNGNPAVVTGLIGGQVQMALMPPGVAMPQVKGGKLRAIGVTTSGKSALVPELPPLSQEGVKDFNLEVWTALVGPASLPRAVQDRLATVVGQIMKTPEVRQRLFNAGWQAVGTSPEGLKRRVEQETALLGGIIRAQNIKLN